MAGVNFYAFMKSNNSLKLNMLGTIIGTVAALFLILTIFVIY